MTLGSVEEAGFFGSTWDSLKLWMNGLFEDEDEAQAVTATEPKTEEAQSEEANDE